MANGFEVSERSSAITALISSGVREWAPYEPSPPKLETAAVSRWEDSPPSGPWTMGYSIPSFAVIRF